ncbi:hypothetical protein [Tautonia plasticadhaerens]|uniref:Uncharacterized protein n=1 Tax=Tautonia plasticadhaerens TaxID=2527974 RepID=A0A518HF43_9BACT|nr:hypothetical protein [Tautonia plasticadhaerens]QDV39462.1 hypothetical protein ElP_74290 [Tautonia plasticadhaerens]
MSLQAACRASGLVALCVVGSLGIGGLAHAEDEGRCYVTEVVFKSEARAEGADEPERLDGRMEIRHRAERKGRSLTVSILSFEAELEGAPVTSLRMSRVGLVEVHADGRRHEITRGEAGPLVRLQLESFGRPALLILHDHDGRPTERLDLAVIGPIADLRLVETATAFHVAFPRQERRWDAEVALPLAKGKLARGTLNFEKIAGEGAGDVPSEIPARVRVSGQLAPVAPGEDVEPLPAEVAYEVEGVQAYDLRARQWVSGDWTIDVSGEVREGGETKTFSGAVSLTLRPAREAGDELPPAGPKD